MSNVRHLKGAWCSEQLKAAELAYADITRIIHVPKQTERHDIATVLLKMTGDGCLNPSMLVQTCIAHLYPLTKTSETRGARRHAPARAPDAVRLAPK